MIRDMIEGSDTEEDEFSFSYNVRVISVLEAEYIEAGC
jgi:hypothetical protein